MCRLVVASVLILFGGNVCLADETGIARDILVAIERTPGLSATAENITSDAGRVTLANVLIAGAGTPITRIEVGRVEFSNLRRSPSDRVVSDRVEMADLKIRTGSVAIDIPGLSLTSLSAPVFDQAPGSLGSLMTLMSRLEFAELAIPKAAYSDINAPDSLGKPLEPIEVSYSNILARDMADGITAEMSVGAIALQKSTDMQFAPLMTIDGASARNVNFAAYATVLDPDAHPETGRDGSWQTIVEAAQYRGIFLNPNANAQLKLSQITIDGYQLRQGPTPLLDHYKGLKSLAETPKGSVPDEAALKAMIGLFQAIRLDRVALSGLSATDSRNAQNSISVDRIQLSDVSADGIGSVLVTAIAVRSPKVLFWLDRFETIKIGFPAADALLAVIRMAEQLPKSPGTTPDEAQIRSIMSVIPTIDRYGLSGLRLTIGAFQPITLASFSAITTDRIYSLPIAGSVVLDSLTVPAEALANGPDPGAKALRDMGYESFVLNIDGASDYREDAGEFEAELTIDLADVADVKLAYMLSGLSRNRLESMMIPRQNMDADEIEALIAMLEGVNLNATELRLRDQSIVNRALAVAAAQSGQGVEQYREQLQAAIPFFLIAIGHPGMQSLIANAVTAFLEGDHEMQIRINPKAPVPLASMIEILQSSPAKAIDLLNPTIESRPLKD